MPDRELTEDEAELRRLIDENDARLDRLRMRNVGITMESQVRMRLNALVDYLIGTDDDAERTEFELVYQRLMGGALAKLEFEVNTQVAPPNGHRGDGLVLP